VIGEGSRWSDAVVERAPAFARASESRATRAVLVIVEC